MSEIVLVYDCGDYERVTKCEFTTNTNWCLILDAVETLLSNTGGVKVTISVKNKEEKGEN